ncbi:TOB [Mytilus coruscus]|uniref:TOB n=1 Tax=Mytilus coruscus TaxID=42192 RepID=A0A6J8B0U2_MYTCO|nr:TOB [Mytilus coruscus]
MREEIAAAVVFLSRLVRQCGSIPNEKMESFSNSLSSVLVEKFKNHWYQDFPAKGQAYRCIRINPEEPNDPVMESAVHKSGLEYKDLKLFCELTLWVDPSDVSCRFGEANRPVCTLATSKDGNLENRAHTVDIDEYLQKEKDRYNNQVNIVTTRSSLASRPYNSNHNLVYNGFNTYQQHNYYNNHRHRNSRRKLPSEQQVNGVRHSPEHVNEVRQQFMNQVNSIAGKANEKSEDQPSSSLSEDSGSSSDSSKSPDQSPEKSQEKKSNKSHQNKGKHTSNLNQGKSKQGSSNQGFKNFQSKSGEQFSWGKGSGPSHSKFNQAPKVH